MKRLHPAGENTNMLNGQIITALFFFYTACPAMRGSTPLDVAASSVMDNNSLALALEEPDLEKVHIHDNMMIK